MSRPLLAASMLAAALVASSCSKAKSPWARKMTAADRVAWMIACGIPAADVQPVDGDADYAYTDYNNRIRSDNPDAALSLVGCHLSWNRTKDQLWYVAIEVGGRGGYEGELEGKYLPLDAATIEPYIRLLLQPVPPEYHSAIRAIALAPVRRGVKVGPFVIDGGHGPAARYWQLAVWAK